VTPPASPPVQAVGKMNDVHLRVQGRNLDRGRNVGFHSLAPSMHRPLSQNALSQSSYASFHMPSMPRFPQGVQTIRLRRNIASNEIKDISSIFMLGDAWHERVVLLNVIFLI
jgi:hypothetical protein